MLASLPSDAKSRLTLSEVETLSKEFRTFAEGDAVPMAKYNDLAASLGDSFGGTKQFREAFANVGATMDFPTFASTFLSTHKSGKVIKMDGSTAGTVHSYSEGEKIGFVEHINEALAGDSDLGADLPIDPTTMKLFDVSAKGVLFCKLLNLIAPGTVKRFKTNPSNKFESNENHAAAIAAAGSMGISTVNVGPTDIGDKTFHLVMGLLWQIIKKHLMTQVKALFEKSEEEVSKTITHLPPEQVLFKWFNQHLEHAGSDRLVTNFDSDLTDGVCFAYLLHDLEPHIITKDSLNAALAEKDVKTRLEHLLSFADRLGCKKFVTVDTIMNGNPRLNLAFVATMFKVYPEIQSGASSAKVREMEEVVEEKAALVTKLETELETVREERGAAARQKEALSEELSDKSSELEARAKELEGVTKTLEDVRVERDTLTKTKTELESQLEAATEDAAAKAATIETLSTEKEQLASTLKEETAAKDKFAADLADLDDLFSEFKVEATETQATLTASLETEKAEREKVRVELEQTQTKLETMMAEAAAAADSLTAELEEAKAAGAQKEAELTSALETEKAEKAEVSSNLAATAAALEEEKAGKAEALSEVEQLKAELAKRDAEIEGLNAKAANLEGMLNAEKELRLRVEEDLKDAEDDLEQTRLESDEEKTLLLQRIRDLEEELEQMRKVMENKLDLAEQQKLLELQKSARASLRALEEAEQKRLAAMAKVRGVLAAISREGFLFMKVAGGVLGGGGWKKMYFVLRGNLLAWYRDEKASTGAKAKPKGLLYVEKFRVYETEDKKHKYAFQLDDGAVQHNLAATELEDMKLWMTDIKEAKKKFLAQKVVSSSADVSDSDAGPVSPRG